MDEAKVVGRRRAARGVKERAIREGEGDRGMGGVGRRGRGRTRWSENKDRIVVVTADRQTDRERGGDGEEEDVGKWSCEHHIAVARLMPCAFFRIPTFQVQLTTFAYGAALNALPSSVIDGAHKSCLVSSGIKTRV